MEGIPEAEIRDHEAQKQCNAQVPYLIVTKLMKTLQNKF